MKNNLDLKTLFFDLISRYQDDITLSSTYWSELEKHYTKNSRHYHNFTHLENLLSQLLEVKDKIEDWDTILFTLYYHDIIYNSLKSDNEEKSAQLAKKRMIALGTPLEMESKCFDQILATKSHIKSDNTDTNYFTDADLSILGSDWDSYLSYFQNVRKEYSIYPIFLYNRGRKKVLQHFLGMNRIYKTDYFYDKLEMRAKENLMKEINYLKGI